MIEFIRGKYKVLYENLMRTPVVSLVYIYSFLLLIISRAINNASRIEFSLASFFPARRCSYNRQSCGVINSLLEA